MSFSLNIRKNVVISISSFVINIILTFVGFRVVIHHCGTSTLGLWAALNSALFIVRLGDVGVGLAVERQIAMIDINVNPKRARKYLDTALVLNSVLFSILSLIGWIVLHKHINWIVPQDMQAQMQALSLLPILLCGLIISNLANVIIGALRGVHLAWQAAYLSIAGSAMQLMIIIIMVPSSGIEGLALAQFMQSLFLGGLAWIFFNNYLRGKLGANLSLFPCMATYDSLKDLLVFSIRAQAANLINAIFEPISKLIIGNFSGMSTLGLFEMAYKIVSLPRNAIISGIQGAMPAMTQLLTVDLIGAKSLYGKSKKIVSKSTFFILLGVSISSPIISILVMGSVSKDLVVFICILAMGFWINSIGAPAYALGLAVGRLTGNIYASLLSVIALVLFSFLFVAIDLKQGPVLACSIALAISGLFVLNRNEKII